MSWWKPKKDPEEDRIHEITVDPVPSLRPKPSGGAAAGGGSGGDSAAAPAAVPTGGLPLPAVCKNEIDVWKEAVSSGSPAKWIVPPPAKIIDVSPPEELQAEQPDVFAQLQEYKTLLQNYAWARAFELVYKRNPQLYYSEDPADMAKCSGKLARQLFLQYQRGFAAILPGTGVAQRSFEQKVTSVELHSALLDAMFGGYKLSSDDMGELDGLLSEFVVTVKSSHDYVVASHKDVGNRAAVTIVTNSIAALQTRDSEGAAIPISDVPLDKRIWEVVIRAHYFELDQQSTVTTVGLLKSVKDKRYRCKMDWVEFKGTINTTVIKDYKEFLKLKQQEIAPNVPAYLKQTATINGKQLTSTQPLTTDDLAGMFAGATYADLNKAEESKTGEQVSSTSGGGTGGDTSGTGGGTNTPTAVAEAK